MEIAAFNYWVGIRSLKDLGLGPSLKNAREVRDGTEQTSILFPLVLCCCWPNEGPKQRAACMGHLCLCGREALGNPCWTQGSPGRPPSALRLKTAGVCHRFVVVTPVIQTGGQGALQSGAGRSCPCSLRWPCRRGRCHARAPGCWAFRDRTSALIRPVSPLCLPPPHFANAFFISLHTLPTSFWLNVLTHPKPAHQHGEILKLLLCYSGVF